MGTLLVNGIKYNSAVFSKAIKDEDTNEIIYCAPSGKQVKVQYESTEEMEKAYEDTNIGPSGGGDSGNKYKVFVLGYPQGTTKTKVELDDIDLSMTDMSNVSLGTYGMFYHNIINGLKFPKVVNLTNPKNWSGVPYFMSNCTINSDIVIENLTFPNGGGLSSSLAASMTNNNHTYHDFTVRNMVVPEKSANTGLVLNFGISNINTFTFSFKAYDMTEAGNNTSIIIALSVTCRNMIMEGDLPDIPCGIGYSFTSGRQPAGPGIFKAMELTGKNLSQTTPNIFGGSCDELYVPKLDLDHGHNGAYIYTPGMFNGDNLILDIGSFGGTHMDAPASVGFIYSPNRLKQLNLHSFVGHPDGNISFQGFLAVAPSLEYLDMASMDFANKVATITNPDGSPSFLAKTKPECLILVKDEEQVKWFADNLPQFTNVQVYSEELAR